MLTIRHIEPSFNETVLAVRRIAYQPPIDGALECVFYDDADGETRSIAAGTVYVMNDRGSTVARYNVGDISKPPSV
jgi:hypothetical protein